MVTRAAETISNRKGRKFMSDEIPDCLGDGKFYAFGRSGEASATDSPAEVATETEEEETRTNPATGASYCLPAMTRALQNGDYYIRMRAALDLGATHDVEAALPLIDLLKDGDRGVRDSAYRGLLSLEIESEPLPVRVLLCPAINDVKRTDIMLGITTARTHMRSVFGYPNVRAYCEFVLNESDETTLNTEEFEVLKRLKAGASAVLRQLDQRESSHVLLRPGNMPRSPGRERETLLRSVDSNPATAPIDNLLIALNDGTGTTEQAKESSDKKEN